MDRQQSRARILSKNGKTILELDPVTLTYGERTKLKDPGIDIAKQQKGTKAKLKALIYQDGRAGQLLWNMTAPVLLYSAHLKGDIADDIQSIDNAMKWGFGWQHGPFELWDAIGVKKPSVEWKRKGTASRPGCEICFHKDMTHSIKKMPKETVHFIRMVLMNRKRETKRIFR
ncbi:3-hydroxyacyl-CoA dehydrogenase family protein [Bacillus sp. B6(2022)]|nr:3-hydroxyacyl-CoA dehydrogenase family protein [Bacillus sp. B6(2022)]